MKFKFLIMAIACSHLAFSQDYSKSLFDSHSDIGTCKIRGNMVYNHAAQEYLLSGSGGNIWGSYDQFHYAWKKLSGDFILRAQVQFIGKGSQLHRKIGWMVRKTLDSNAAVISGTVHGDGLTSLQYRLKPGTEMTERRSTVQAPDVIQLERKGDQFILSVARYGQPFDTVRVMDAGMTGEVYAGLFICSHDNNVLEKARFFNVRIILPAKDNYIPYKVYLGSNLEIMDMATGNRKVIWQSPVSIQAPNWTTDGKSLIFNSEGALFNFNLQTGKPSKINSGEATNNNNDHVISFDGKMLGISNHVASDGNNSNVFVMPVTGGTPERITAKGPSYLHGWSPDGKYLVFTGSRDNDYNIFKIGRKEKKEIQLTTAKGLDDGPEYSPDGKYIYFNSTRTGAMKLWRMKPDGSEQQQLTFDEYNDWFPHISPDGQWIVFLSFLKEVKPDDHPFYKHVYLRLMPVTGGAPKVVAYVYGGQGTINVPSWSPDSKKIAFVSNTGFVTP